MKVPFSWLTEFVEITDTPEQLAEKLLLSGTKIESIEKNGSEVVFETEITSNRPDTLSIYGVAREIAAITNTTLKRFSYPLKQQASNLALDITIEDPNLCPVYTSVIVDNITIGPSPEWMKRRLELSGIRSINNVVDISNYVMLEYGQPMHTFDYDKISGQTMVLRGSKKGEKVIPLDGIERVLKEGTIIIEDDTKLIDLAGILGGANSEISQNTKRVFLHVAIYDPIAIRKASKYLGLRSESSNRFEKKLDLKCTQFTMERAVRLLEEYAGGRVASVVYHVDSTHYKSPKIDITEKEIETLVGIPFSKKDILSILTRLEFTIHPHGNTYTLQPPSFRRDIAIPQDVIEELVRIYGYNNLPLTLPKGDIPIQADAFEKNWNKDIRIYFTSVGYTEVYSSTLTSQKNLENIAVDPDKTLKVLHPMSIDFEYMRPSLLPGLLGMIHDNLYTQQSVAIFEVGTVFSPYKIATEDVKKNLLPDQPAWITAVSTYHTYQEIKGIAEYLCQMMGISPTQSNQSDMPAYFLPSQSISIGHFGAVGRIDPIVLEAFGIEKDVWAIELDIDQMIWDAKPITQYPIISPYPPTIEDLTFVLPKKTHIGPVIDTIKDIDPTIASADLSGEFKDAKTFHITYQNPTKTLESKEVEEIRSKIISSVEQEFKAKLKGKV